MATRTPHATWWHLHERQAEVHGRGQRFGIDRGPSPLQDLTKLGCRAWTFVQALPTGPEQRFHIHAGEPAREGRDTDITSRAQEEALVHGRDHGPHGERVARRHEMDRSAHQPRADGTAIGDELRELVSAEADETRPQRDVRVGRHLRLHADEVFDRALRGHLRAAQQELPLEQRPIEHAPAEDHAAGIVEPEIRAEGVRWTGTLG